MDLYGRRSEKMEEGGTMTQAPVMNYVDAAMYLTTELRVLERLLCKKAVNVTVPVENTILTRLTSSPTMMEEFSHEVKKPQYRISCPF